MDVVRKAEQVHHLSVMHNNCIDLNVAECIVRETPKKKKKCVTKKKTVAAVARPIRRDSVCIAQHYRNMTAMPTVRRLVGDVTHFYSEPRVRHTGRSAAIASYTQCHTPRNFFL
jgi:hypothetical protein